jgi:hypothetical protein
MKSTIFGLGLAGIVACSVVGCSPNRTDRAATPPATTSANPPVGTEDKATERPGPIEPGSTEPGATSPPPVAKDKPDASPDGNTAPKGKFRPPNVHIPPIEAAGSQNWRPANIGAAELGRRMDEAMARFKGVYAEATMLLDVPAGKGDIHSKIEVFDPSRYRYEYSLPETNVSPYIVIADGDHRAELDGKRARWTKPTPLVKPSGLKPGSPDQIVREFPERFPRHLLDPIVRATASWEPLLGAWASGKAGYRAIVEEKAMPVQGKNRNFYRVVAQRKADDTRIELLLDAEHLVPVTVRVEKRKADAVVSQVQWQAKWSFTRKLDPKRLIIPTK